MSPIYSDPVTMDRSCKENPQEFVETLEVKPELSPARQKLEKLVSEACLQLPEEKRQEFRETIANQVERRLKISSSYPSRRDAHEQQDVVSPSLVYESSATEPTSIKLTFTSSLSDIWQMVKSGEADQWQNLMWTLSKAEYFQRRKGNRDAGKLSSFLEEEVKGNKIPICLLEMSLEDFRRVNDMLMEKFQQWESDAHYSVPSPPLSELMPETLVESSNRQSEEVTQALQNISDVWEKAGMDFVRTAAMFNPGPNATQEEKDFYSQQRREYESRLLGG